MSFNTYSIVQDDSFCGNGQSNHCVLVFTSCISTSKENVRVPSGLQALLVQLLGRDERYHELRQFVAGKLIDPSRAVALQLLDVGNSDVETRKTGMEMLRLLHAHSDYVNLLLQDGRLLEGLRYMRQNKV